MTLTYTVRPLTDRASFPGEHVDSQFTADWSDTVDLLERELTALRAERVVIEVDVTERGIRLDGQLRADAKAASPAVRVAFDSRFGPLQYATDRFVRPSWRKAGAREDWQHNVRAIALGLEALRRVDRYGISKRGEQYTGWKALPAGESAIAVPSAMTVEQAAELLVAMSDVGLSTSVIERVIVDSEYRKQLHRQAAKGTHPDRDFGDAAAFHRLQEARRVLDEYGSRS